MTEIDRSIEGAAKTVEDIMSGKKYSIDYYQRAYKWESKHLGALVADLTTKFLQLYDSEHERKDVARYPGYFLGSIIISSRDSKMYIVDGQQRLTSLTLLLMYLRRLQADRQNAVDLDKLILSVKWGEKSFNLNVPDRNRAMEGLFESGEFEPPANASESVRNLVDRYTELDELFPDELRDDALPYFADWLVDRVQLVQITAYSDDDAYAIFETMNDRGLKLTPTDMLKGYLLTNIEQGQPRTEASELWRNRFRDLDDRSADAGPDFLKTWLRSQYSTKIRERRKGARPEDWDRIGTEFHRWLRESHQRIGLNSRNDFSQFVVRDLDFFSRQYERILDAAVGPFDASSPLRFIRYNADLNFTLQYQLLLAPLAVDDDPSAIEAKLEIVGRFVDILVAWRIWNFRSTDYSTMQYAMFTVLRDIRGLDVHQLAETLTEYLEGVEETFDSRDDLYVHQQNRSRLHKILARLTDYITVASGRESNYLQLTNGGQVKYEVEHIWADRYERHTQEFEHESDFTQHRNRIGDLLLLPKSFNASYGDAPYEDKQRQYAKQNLLAASLSPLCYEKDPGFARFLNNSNLPFTSYDEFTKKDIVERGHLYREIAKMVWDPAALTAVAQRIG